MSRKRPRLTEEQVRREWEAIITRASIPIGTGHTVLDLVQKYQISETTARRRIRKAMADGKVRRIGIRNGAVVYDLLRNDKG